MNNEIRQCIKKEGSAVSENTEYGRKLAQEIQNYQSCDNVHDLPGIFFYWYRKHIIPKLLPFGFSYNKDLFFLCMKQVCSRIKPGSCRFVSLGAGNSDFEAGIVSKLLQSGVENFTMECVDLNRHMLERSMTIAKERGIADWMKFSQSDINSWEPLHEYHVILAVQSLHHILELERLFENIDQSLEGEGYFLTDDMIGRNGHMRWPEAYSVLSEFWKQLPERYKYNHLLKRLESEYENWDCSKEGFEGIRSQDILPLLVERFHFDFFFGFGNVINVFVDRCFGHNFNPANKWDCSFIDAVHLTDQALIEQGRVKPTQMITAMTKSESASPRFYKHLSPEFCIRRP